MTSLNRVLLIVAAIWGNVVWSTHASPASSQSRSPSLSQFCMDDKVYTFDLCMAFSHRRDDPSTYRLAFSGAFNKAHGWAALAHGSIMDGAIMFVFYPNRRADGLTVSVRSTTGHSPPKTLPQHNDNLKLLRTFVDGEGYYHAVIDCESCRLPPPGASAVQPNETWIWSANDYQVLTSDEPGEELQVHSSYGRFIVDVRPNDLDLDNITQHYPDRTNGGARGGNKQNTQGATAVQVHGILMLVVFVGIYPLGIVMIRSGLARAFRYHVGSQLAATLIVLLLAMLGAWSALKRDQRPTLVAHELLGTLLVVAVLYQVALGYFHHRLYRVARTKTTYSRLHRLSGYVILLASMANATLGLQLGQPAISLWLIIGIYAVACLGWFCVSVILMKMQARKAIGPSKQSRDMGQPEDAAEMDLMIPK